ncbi:MAG: lysylphosphatidylglycerol synthase transmembrane domain-containing protein [Aminobacterium sp.]|uniref:lysylphosphatidylglycerol synthase transmembrane domain-containing protein n=1 Tax=unclassified Aminobacterium TaxID=2685012 RepID=UPI001BCF5B2E|nr:MULTISPECIES: lysylphosphatidylglycerol synthase transmembrane domain-containing protein [unclassified Aminobacterium]MDD2206100.1 lysylphosphatidylglycerol synthase transmembrane domain-containing protein [Aminobacterium sp.]MDD3426754.1 lysylphosphatidylglycerol synthase transmembrane domain-containing protein [Aminobacterium sp.]MDD3707819.1 lysylphosphatidylglycerol synthase transmembrane domain-containing protein [Aminobacterium sp.]MDD4228056.1 lysylphosphatidylglycerol synthase transm
MSLRKGLVVFLTLTFGVSALVLISSVDESTVEMLFTARKSALVVALLLVFGAWCCDAMRFCAIARAASERVTFRLGLVLTWLHYFGCAVTPMQSGGGPFQVFVLYKHDMPIGKGVAITLTRTLLTLLLLGVVVPMAILFEPELLGTSLFVKSVFTYVAIFVGISWVLVVLSLTKPQLMKRWGQILTLMLKRFGIVKHIKVLSVIRRVNREIDNYSENFRLFFTSGFPHFVGAIILSGLHLLCLFSVLPCLIWAVGLPVHYLQAFMAQAVFMFVLYFVPTPGASGVAEGGGAALFGLLVPWHVAGVMAILWRFFTEYLAIGMGAAVAIRLLGWGTSEEIFMNEREKLDHDA